MIHGLGMSGLERSCGITWRSLCGAPGGWGGVASAVCVCAGDGSRLRLNDDRLRSLHRPGGVLLNPLRMVRQLGVEELDGAIFLVWSGEHSKTVAR